jgi:hypothetical protein
VVVLAVVAMVTSCSVAGGPTVERSEAIATDPESLPSVPSPPSEPELVTTTSVIESEEAPRQQATTVPEAVPDVPPPVDLDELSRDAGIARTSLTAEAELGPESSLFSLVTSPDGTALIAGAARDDGLPVATVWAIDSGSGAVEEQWVLPSPPGIAATARDVAVLADGSMVVVGAIFASTGAVPVSWRVAPGSIEPLQILPCECASAEAERIVVDGEGGVWVVGRDPGWRGTTVVWTSGDEGRSWAGRRRSRNRRRRRLDGRGGLIAHDRVSADDRVDADDRVCVIEREPHAGRTGDHDRHQNNHDTGAGSKAATLAPRREPLSCAVDVDVGS